MYFGNEDPANETFSEIVPKTTKVLNYWKQFNITNMGKARIVEMFLVAKLIYAIKFYNMPRNFREQLQKEINDFVTFPETHTIEQKELWKTKQKGGIKLINLEIKSDTCKVKWLLEMVSNPICNINLLIFTELIGRQKGDITGRHLFFCGK